jgi:hypothetical protein
MAVIPVSPWRSFTCLFGLVHCKDLVATEKTKQKQSPWLLIGKRTIPTDRLPPVGEF